MSDISSYTTTIRELDTTRLFLDKELRQALADKRLSIQVKQLDAPITNVDKIEDWSQRRQAMEALQANNMRMAHARDVADLLYVLDDDVHLTVSVQGDEYQAQNYCKIQLQQGDQHGELTLPHHAVPGLIQSLRAYRVLYRLQGINLQIDRIEHLVTFDEDLRSALDLATCASLDELSSSMNRMADGQIGSSYDF